MASSNRILRAHATESTAQAFAIRSTWRHANITVTSSMTSKRRERIDAQGGHSQEHNVSAAHRRKRKVISHTFSIEAATLWRTLAKHILQGIWQKYLDSTFNLT